MTSENKNGNLNYPKLYSTKTKNYIPIESIKSDTVFEKDLGNPNGYMLKEDDKHQVTTQGIGKIND